QAHAAVLSELLRGHGLAAGDSGHVGDDGLDLGDAVIAEELPDLAHDPLGFFTLLRRAHGWPPRTLRTAPSKTDCSSPSTPGATVPRARSAGRCAPGTPRSLRPARVLRPQARARGDRSPGCGANSPGCARPRRRRAAARRARA